MKYARKNRKEIESDCNEVVDLISCFSKENLPYLFNQIVFDDEFLSILVKLRFLFPYALDYSFCKNIWLWNDFPHKRKVTEEDKVKLKEYDKWVENNLNEEYLQKEERERIENYKSMGRHSGFNLYDNFDTESLESIFDLLSLINPNKIEKLEGNLWLNYSMIYLQRQIEIVYWHLYKKPLKDNGGIIPYFCYKEENEFIKYKLSVLNEFELLPEDFYTLWVEGQTENEIMDLYIREFSFIANHFPIKIRKLHSSGDLKHVNRLRKSEYDFFYVFIDYDNEKKYQIITKNVPKENFSVFKPDFITSNFTCEESVMSYQKFLEFLGFKLENDEDLKNLMKEENSHEITIRNHFKNIFYDKERISICNKIMMEERFIDYRRFITHRSLDNSMEIKDFSKRGNRNKNLTDFIKTFLTKEFCKIIRNDLGARKNAPTNLKSRKFKFEEEFKKFYLIMRNIRERNKDNKWGYLKPNDDKTRFSIS